MNNKRNFVLGLSGILFLGVAGSVSAQGLPPGLSLSALEPVLETVEGVTNNLGSTLGLTSVIGEGSPVNNLLDQVAGEKNESDDPETNGDVGGTNQVLGLLSSVGAGFGGHGGGGIDSSVGGVGGGGGLGGHLGLPDLLP